MKARRVGPAQSLTFVLLCLLFGSNPLAEGAAPKGGGTAPKDDEQPSLQPARLLPLSSFHRTGQWIESGLRVERTEAEFSSGGEPHGLLLPPHLGGGALFYQATGADGDAGTSLYRAESWTGELEPLARIPYAVRTIVAGFDRIYLVGVAITTALDPKTGESLSLAPLPEVAAIEGLAFFGPERAVISAPLVGVLYTNNSGLSWRRLEEARELRFSPSALAPFVLTSSGIRQVSEDGRLLSVARPPPLFGWETVLSDSLLNHEQNWIDGGSWDPKRESALRAIVERGVVLGPHSLALDRGEILTLENDGKFFVKRTPSLSEKDAVCLPSETGREMERDLLFFCQGSSSEVLLLPLKDALALSTNSRRGVPPHLRSIHRSSLRRKLLGRGEGALLLEGSCEDRPDNAISSSGPKCLVSTSGPTTVEPSAISLQAKEALRADMTHAWAISEDSLWLVWNHRKQKELRAVQLWAQTPKSRNVKLRRWSFAEDASLEEFLSLGSLLPHASLSAEGFSLWATERNHFVGLLLGDDEQPSFFAIQRPLARAAFDGPRVLLWGAAGFAKQSHDGGRSFQEVTLPYRSGDPPPSEVLERERAVNIGCSSAGCLVGNFARFGWGERRAEPLNTAPAKNRPNLGPGRFHFECSEGSQSSPPRNAETDGAFPAFWESPAPHFTPGQEGISVGLPLDLARLYAWGPEGPAWGREGQIELRFIDPWNPVIIRRTAPTRQLFSSLLSAKNALGVLDPSRSFPSIAFDPSGNGGVLLLKTQVSTDLIVFKEGEALAVIPGAHEMGLRSLLSAVNANGTWYSAFQMGSRVSVVRLDSQVITEVANLSLGEAGLRSFQLVRTKRGDLGVSIEGDAGLLVYSLSTKGALGDPLLVPHLSNRPDTCAIEASGFIVDRLMSISPYLEGGEEMPLRVSDLRARWIVGIGKPCLEAMTARSRADPEASAQRLSGNTLPLTVINSDSKGRRTELTCK
jgi:hypothetical protein